MQRMQYPLHTQVIFNTRSSFKGTRSFFSTFWLFKILKRNNERERVIANKNNALHTHELIHVHNTNAVIATAT